VLGTSRKQNEDRYVTQQLTLSDGSSATFFGVFDGHGGFAASEWLSRNLSSLLSKHVRLDKAKESLAKAFDEADSVLLAPQGFLGMGARGLGGPRCGSTCVIALVVGRTLVVANCGDSRAVLVAGGKAEILSIDHVPDNETERYRIENKNPNKKKPLVRYVESTWRVGGLLALSRAFGNAYMKASGLDEGYGTAQDDYGSGFGVICTPDLIIREMPASGDAILVLSSDGLYANEERGGGGGLDLPRVAQLAAAEADLSRLAQRLCSEAVEAGSTDDVTVLCVKL